MVLNYRNSKRYLRRYLGPVVDHGHDVGVVVLVVVVKGVEEDPQAVPAVGASKHLKQQKNINNVCHDFGILMQTTTRMTGIIQRDGTDYAKSKKKTI